MTFDTWWQTWPKSPRKGAKSLVKAKWDKMKLDTQAEQIIAHTAWMTTTNDWKKDNGSFIPAPLVYINQLRWDGAEIPEMTINVNVSFVDPALKKMDEDAKKAAPIPQNVREMLERLKRGIGMSEEVMQMVLDALQDAFLDYSMDKAAVIRHNKAIKALEEELSKVSERVAATDIQISYEAHIEDPEDWNDLNFKECWYKGFSDGFKAAEVFHKIGVYK